MIDTLPQCKGNRLKNEEKKSEKAANEQDKKTWKRWRMYGMQVTKSTRTVHTRNAIIKSVSIEMTVLPMKRRTKEKKLTAQHISSNQSLNGMGKYWCTACFICAKIAARRRRQQRICMSDREHVGMQATKRNALFHKGLGTATITWQYKQFWTNWSL